MPLVIDADGLFALGTDLELLADRARRDGAHAPRGRAGPTAGHERRRGRRPPPAPRLARRPGAAAATVLLKGARTIVADPDGTAFVVPTGNPGLATPGTGDVLTGIIAGQLAKGLSATEAACLGGYVHGLAADLAVDTAVSTEGMIASDLFDFLPLAVERLVLGDDDRR